MMAVDFGDAPAPYPTTTAENGARHEAIGPQLGATRDMEANGAHSAAADGDGADEDGVTFGTLQVGALGATATVTVQGATGPGARLDAWIDFNGDGNWGGPGEQIANNVLVANGANPLTFDIPSTAVPGVTFARFRVSTVGNLGMRGLAADGEVEDYRVTLGTPAPTSALYTARRTVSITADGAESVATADMDGDGDMDLLSASQLDDEVTWYENDGQQNFTGRLVAATLDGVRSVVPADVDGDGDMDIITAATGLTAIVWFENNGSQVFTQRTVVASGAPSTRNLYATDMDGDGDMDIVSAHGNRVAWYENNGSQSFTQRLLPFVAMNGGVSAAPPVDLDGDGDMDVVYCTLDTGAGDGVVGWYENNGSQTFTHREISDINSDRHSIAAADFDGDGDIDLVQGATTESLLVYYRNDGAQNFQQITLPMGLSVWHVQPADLDGDGDMDIITSGFTAAPNTPDQIVAWMNTGQGIFNPRTITTEVNTPHGAVAADVDGDGDADVVTAAFGDDRIAWFEARPAGDYDGDGDTDGNDFLILQRVNGTVSHPPGSSADGDFSGIIDTPDFQLFFAGYGAKSNSAPPVAEPNVEATMAPSVVMADGDAAGDDLAAASVIAEATTSTEAGDDGPLFATNVLLAGNLFALPKPAATTRSAYRPPVRASEVTKPTAMWLAADAALAPADDYGSSAATEVDDADEASAVTLADEAFAAW